MLNVLWEIVLPLLVAFAVGWVVMGWLTWRWRRAGVSEAEWVTVTTELRRARSALAQAQAERAGADPVDHRVAPPVEAPRTGSEPPADDLKAIRGVGAKMESKLNELGVTSLRQVAAFTDEDVARISAGIGAFPGRIERDRWVPQAKELVAQLADEG